MNTIPDKIKVDSYYNNGIIGYNIAPDGFNKRVICVSKVKNLTDFTWRPAEINWSATGDQNIKNTKAFSDALNYACELAKWLDENHPK